MINVSTPAVSGAGATLTLRHGIETLVSYSPRSLCFRDKQPALPAPGSAMTENNEFPELHQLERIISGGDTLTCRYAAFAKSTTDGRHFPSTC